MTPIWNPNRSKIEEQSIIYKVGNSIKNQLLIDADIYDSNTLINLNKLTKDFQEIDIPILDSLIKK